ncbi:hypothetical protein ABW19_dt0204793 [Dactylella cylindrospora]|nr:hypothetical protein ABW19_dt0204793 [Dactylella cylindrospora]
MNPVFRITELLELIFLELPATELLASTRTVCRTWNNVILDSPLLQWHTFRLSSPVPPRYHPPPGHPSKETPDQVFELSPIIARAFKNMCVEYARLETDSAQEFLNLSQKYKEIVSRSGTLLARPAGFHFSVYARFRRSRLGLFGRPGEDYEKGKPRPSRRACSESPGLFFDLLNLTLQVEGNRGFSILGEWVGKNDYGLEVLSVFHRIDEGIERPWLSNIACCALSLKNMTGVYGEIDREVTEFSWVE